MNSRQSSVIMCLATGCFVGNIPFAPGTFGSIAGLLLCFLFSAINPSIAIIGTLLLIISAIWIADKAEKIIGTQDPGCIVLDEIAGIAVTLAGLPFTFTYVAAGFFIFRILDILKPFPIRTLERKFSGGAGIVLDDVAAGIIGNIVLRIVFYLAGKF
jgi:phosphatidylglycerophosphatase A